MRKILFIHSDPGIAPPLQRLAQALKTKVELAETWQAGRSKLFEDRYDLVLVDYDALKVDGLEGFVLLDNILHKEQTPGLLLSMNHFAEARKFADSLASVKAALLFSIPDIDTTGFAARLKSYLDETPATPPSAAEEGKLRHQDAPPIASEPSQPTSTPQGQPIEVDVRLPRLSEGELRHVPLSRLLYTIHVHKSTGDLDLRMGQVERRFSFGEGNFMEERGLEMGQVKALCSAFAWGEGHFSFSERQAVSGKPKALIPVIRSGIEEYVTQRRVMEALMPMMKSYPVATQLWPQRQTALAWPVLGDFLGYCKGEATLEKVLSLFGAQITAAFVAGYFAKETDLLFLRSEPTARTVIVSYGPQVQYDPQAANPDEQRKKSKAYRAAGTERLALKAELVAFHDNLQRYTPHQVFGLWEGCGRKVVQERFYVMVKEHHPDVYGGNVSNDIRSLSQRIFIAVKDAYAELMKIEGEQTVAPPAEDSPVDKPEASASSSAHTPRPVQMTPVAVTPSSSGRGGAADTPGRAQHRTAPISMSREPSSLHPDLAAQTRNEEARKQKFESFAARQEQKTNDVRRERLEKLVSHQSTKVDRAEKLQALSGPQSKSPAPRSNPSASAPSAQTPEEQAKFSFNEGYKKFRNQQYPEALPLFEKAYTLEPENGLYTTFFAYTTFQTNAEAIDEAQDLLEKAIKTGHRQALPDAHLFLGYVLKIKGLERKAHRNFEMALSLNPTSVDAKREIRLYEMRHKDSSSSDPVGFLKNMFKK